MVNGTNYDHKCPKNGCEKMVDFSRLACYPHWRLVPWKLGNELHRLWVNDAGSKEYYDVRGECIDAMNGKEPGNGNGNPSSAQ